MTTATVISSPSDTVAAFLNALARKDYALIQSLLADNLVYTNVSLPTLHGGSRVSKIMKRGLGSGVDFGVEIHQIAAQGSVVLTERTDYIKVGPLHIGFWVCGTFEVKDGKITLWRDYFDWLNVSKGTVQGLAGIIYPRRRAALPLA